MSAKSNMLQLQEIAPSDLEEVARFIARISGSATPPQRAVERLSWILLENPARAPGDPLGWLLRSPSEGVVGCMCCAPQRFCLGATTLTLMMANSFYVDERHRGAGTSILLKYLQLARRYPLFVSSANATVAEMWQRLGGYSLGNSDCEVFGILRWPPLLAERVHRATASDGLAQVASALAHLWLRARRDLFSDAAPGTLTMLDSPEKAAYICTEHRSEKITSNRDAAYLKWRYFSSADPSTRLFAFSRDADQEKSMVAVRLQTRGYRQQIRSLQVLDIWGEPDSQALLGIAASLWREYNGQIDMLVFRCLNPEQQQILTARDFKVRFKVRPFAASIAWCIDKNGLLPGRNWYFVPADGDMFL